jgi:hypothetical protein
VPSHPPASVIFKAHQRHHQAVQAVGEATRSERPVRIAFGDTFGSSLDAALWRHDPERRDVVEGGVMLKERLVFTWKYEARRAPGSDA